MKTKELKLGIKKLPAEETRFTIVCTPSQRKQLKLIALNNNTTVKGMIFKAFGIE
jgi:hypothetical protein